MGSDLSYLAVAGTIGAGFGCIAGYRNLSGNLNKINNYKTAFTSALPTPPIANQIHRDLYKMILLQGCSMGSYIMGVAAFAKAAVEYNNSCSSIDSPEENLCRPYGSLAVILLSSGLIATHGKLANAVFPRIARSIMEFNGYNR